jgi:hypothetical protein
MTWFRACDPRGLVSEADTPASTSPARPVGASVAVVPVPVPPVGSPQHSEQLAAKLFLAGREIATLTEALKTRTVIGQAMGLLMARGEISADAAFAQLRMTSSHTNVKIRDLATRLVQEADERAGP